MSSIEGDSPADLSIAVVSTYPPTKGNLSEYTYHLVEAYRRRKNVTVDVLATKEPETPARRRRRDVNVYRLWKRDAPLSTLRLLRKIAGGGYDAVHFNLCMSSFGKTRTGRFVGLSLPIAARIVASAPVVVTLHDLLEIVDEQAVPEPIGFAEKLGASIATQLVLLTDAVTVTHRDFKNVIEEKYLLPNVYYVPHGEFERSSSSASLPSDPFRILLFGHLSPTKDYATVFEAFERLRRTHSDVELQVAGDSHPNYPGMRERLERKYGDTSGVSFLGYVPEDELGEVFDSSSVLVLPYRTCTGVSGVYHLAKAYEIPTVAYDTAGMRDATIGTGGVVEFVEPESPSALTATLADLKNDPARLEELSVRMREANSQPSFDETARNFVQIIRGVAHD